MKKLLAAVMFMAITAASAAFAAPEYTIKVGYIGSDTHPTMQAMKAFAKDVDTGSKGKIKVEMCIRDRAQAPHWQWRSRPRRPRSRARERSPRRRAQRA